MARDYYDALGVSRTASTKELPGAGQGEGPRTAAENFMVIHAVLSYT
jgi:hypothetical protein